MSLLGANVVGTHVLPAWPKMTVEKYKTALRTHRIGNGALEVRRQEASVAVHPTLSVARKDHFLDEAGKPRVPLTWVPDPEAKVFLVIWTQQMSKRPFVDCCRNRHAIRRRRHCVSNRRRTCAKTSRAVRFVCAQCWMGRLQYWNSASNDWFA